MGEDAKREPSKCRCMNVWPAARPKNVRRIFARRTVNNALFHYKFFYCRITVRRALSPTPAWRHFLVKIFVETNKKCTLQWSRPRHTLHTNAVMAFSVGWHTATQRHIYMKNILLMAQENGIFISFVRHNKIVTHLLICAIIICDVCLHASTNDRRTLRTFSRNSGQSFDWPMCMSKSRKKATWLLISTMSCK